MTRPDDPVVRYYGGPDLQSVIMAAATGPDGRLDPAILSQVDEFHTGGFAATERLLEVMQLTPGTRLLDIGAGVGGPARHAARRAGAIVTGIDLTPRFVSLARDLTRRLEISEDRVRFVSGNALALPFDDGSFDAAMMLHVGMNIADKPALMAGVARVLRPGGRLAIYDLMRAEDVAPEDALTWPMPWAEGAALSFLETEAEYRAAAAAAGLTVAAVHDRSPESRAFFTEMRARAAASRAEGRPPPPGIGLVMGDDAPQKLANLAAAVMSGRIVPIELHLRKRDPG